MNRKIYSLCTLFFIIFNLLNTPLGIHIEEAKANDTYVSKMVVNFLGDVTWIESQPSSKPEITHPNTPPSEKARDFFIHSKKEIISATDVHENKELFIRKKDGIYTIRVPFFPYMKSIEIEYLDDVKKDETPKHYPEWAMERISSHNAIGVSVKNQNEDAFFNLENKVAEMGFSQYVRHTKSNSNAGSLFWPSESVIESDGTFSYKDKNDDVETFVKNADKNNLNIIAYYKDTGDEMAAARNPDSVCKDGDGQALDEKGKIFMDFTDPGYKEVILTQLKELAERGVKGFYFDFIHMPTTGCYGTKLEEDFVRDTGFEAPHGDRWTLHDNYAQYIQYQADKLTEVFAYLEDALQTEYPNVFFIISTTYTTGLTSHVHNHALVENADMPKIEIDHGRRIGLRHQVFTKDDKDDQSLQKPSDQILMITAASLTRDLSKGELFHMWASSFPNADHLKGFVYFATAMGGIADIQLASQYADPEFNEKDYTKDRVGQTDYESYQPGIGLGQDMSNIMKDKMPMQFAGVLFSEELREEYEKDYESAWHEAIWPSVGAYESFLKEGMPVTIVSDNTLKKKLEELKIIAIPTSITDASSTHQKILTDFQKRGGIIIEAKQSEKWGSPLLEDNKAAYESMRSRISQYKTEAPFWVEKTEAEGNERVYPFFYDNLQNELFIDDEIFNDDTLNNEDDQSDENNSNEDDDLIEGEQSNEGDFDEDNEDNQNDEDNSSNENENDQFDESNSHEDLNESKQINENGSNESNQDNGLNQDDPQDEDSSQDDDLSQGNQGNENDLEYTQEFILHDYLIALYDISTEKKMKNKWKQSQELIDSFIGNLDQKNQNKKEIIRNIYSNMEQKNLYKASPHRTVLRYLRNKLSQLYF